MNPLMPEQLTEVLATLRRLKDHRDAIVLETLARTGMRSHEAATLTVQAVNLKSGYVQVTACKDSEDHIVPIPTEFAKRLYRHLSDYSHLMGHITDSTEVKSITARMRECLARNRSMFPPEFSLHDLRASFAVAVYVQTKDMLLVKQLLGHRSITSTEQYVRLATAATRRKEVLQALK